MELQFAKENFDNEVMKSDKPVLVDFYADWCGPCRMMLPIVEEMAKEYDGKIKVGKVNVDEQQDLAAQFGIMSIPSFLFVKDGKVVESSAGAMSKDQMRAKLDALISA